MFSTERNEKRKFTLECIRVYRDHSALWNITSDDYIDRNKRNHAYDVLLKKYQERFPTATLNDVKKKLYSLRTNYRKELKKVNDSYTSGAGLEDIYQSHLWYFNEMDFLRDQETLARSRSTLQILPPPKFANSSNVDDQIDGITETVAEDNGKNVQTVKKKPAKRSAIQRNERLSLACKRLCVPESEELQIAKTWANELLKMNKSQQTFAKKGIADILFEGQLGTLKRDSIQINSISSTVSTPYSYTPVPTPNPSSWVMPSAAHQNYFVQTQTEPSGNTDTVTTFINSFTPYFLNF